MTNSYYKGYWMITNRCNLNCSYCVLENAPHQLQAELDLENKKDFISHLYHKLKFRRLTLSGGEALIIGKKPPHDFLELLQYIKQFRSNKLSKNLEIELYTNGTYLNKELINQMRDVVDMIAITIDSKQNNILNNIGRKYNGLDLYYRHIIEVIRLLTKNSIKVKLHSVISQRNYLNLPNEVEQIVKSIEVAQGNVSNWKFYQYMSYDDQERDQEHMVSEDEYNNFRWPVKEALKNYSIDLHFKDNKEMHGSLFNILSYGNAQYMRENDTWLTSQRTRDLRTYNSMQELFSQHDINEKLFRKFHEIKR